MIIRDAHSAEDIALIRELWLEYAASLGFSLCFQNFDEELASLPGRYAPPAGRLLLGSIDGQIAGTIALRPLDQPGVCEMKRLYVRPQFRGHGAGRKLVDAVIGAALHIGYTHMRLDTVSGKMDAAIAMYKAYGFQQTAAYTPNPQQNVIYMELELPTAAPVKGSKS